MKQNQDIVSELDIKALLTSPLEIKLQIIKQIGKFYKSGNFSEEQKKAAERILTSLIKESDVEVKKNISEAVKDSDNLSNNIAMTLAQDINIVAVPILEFSNSLTDENLIYIIKKANDEEKEKSISRRETVSEEVSHTLIETGHEDVVATLLNNKGAEVSEEDYNAILENFNETESVLSVLKQRAKLPLSIVKTLKEDFAEKLSDEEHVISDAPQDIDKEHYQFTRIVQQHGIQENISPIYALCLGNIKLFEICVARQLKIPIMNVRTILDDGSENSFYELYKRTGLPDNLFYATEALLCVLNSLGDELAGKGVKISERDSKRITLKFHEVKN